MHLKNGVKLQGIRPELLIAIMVANDAYKSESHELRITSVLDGKHSRNSLHYAGQAVDLGTRGLPVPVVERIAGVIRGNLTIDFDVIVESTHIHIEYQPRG